MMPLGGRYWTLGTIRQHVAHPLPEENGDADWTLAEAAPDLLAALEEIERIACRSVGGSHPEDEPEPANRDGEELANVARAAIARAKGSP